MARRDAPHYADGGRLRGDAPAKIAMGHLLSDAAVSASMENGENDDIKQPISGGPSLLKFDSGEVRPSAAALHPRYATRCTWFCAGLGRAKRELNFREAPDDDKGRGTST